MPREATRDHLARLYAADPDPWGHLTRPFERAKYRATLAAVGAGPFRSGIEIGCGNGALSLELAPRCARLTALEMIPAACRLARDRLARFAHVQVIEGSAPGDLPDLAPDLVVLSEVLYFLTPDEIAGLAGWIGEKARPGCRIVAVNWTGSTGETLTGATAMARLRDGLPGWTGPPKPFEGFVIDVLTAEPAGDGDRTSRAR